MLNPTRVADYGDYLRNHDQNTYRHGGRYMGSVQEINGGLVTAAEMTQYASATTDFQNSADFADLHRRYSLSRSTVALLENPGERSIMLPWFFSWLRREHRHPFIDTNATTPTAPTTDERHTFTFWARQPDFDPIFGEIDREWLARFRDDARNTTDTSFEQMISRPHGTTIAIKRLMRQLIDDGADPNRGLTATPPALDITDIAATVAEIRAINHLTPAQMEPWRKTIARWIGEVGHEQAIVYSDWATSPAERMGLEGMIQRPSSHFASYARFAEWLERNGQTAPDATTPAAVPSGDTVLAIGPEHPGWLEFWRGARRAADSAGYRSYYDRLAREFHVPDLDRSTAPVMEQRTYQVTFEFTDTFRTDAPAPGVATFRDHVASGAARFERTSLTQTGTLEETR